MFESVLVASRAVSSVRIARSLRKMGIRVVVTYSEADRYALHVLGSDRAICIGGASGKNGYENADAIVDAARLTGVQAIHPGDGHFADNADFAEALVALGLVFVGPRPGQLRALGDLESTRLLAKRLQVPHWSSDDEAAKQDRWRCIEVQIVGDGRGEVVALGDWDCTLKVRGIGQIVESPAPSISNAMREGIFRAAVAIGRSITYESVGSIRFMCDVERNEFVVRSAQPHLTPEHASVELATGVDLVQWMVQTAAGKPPELLARGEHRCSAALAVQIRAEDPARGDIASVGRLTEVALPEQTRIDTWVERGTEVTPGHDALLATLAVSGDTRDIALERLEVALNTLTMGGLETNIAQLQRVVTRLGAAPNLTIDSKLSAGATSSRSIEVLTAGTFSQDLRLARAKSISRFGPAPRGGTSWRRRGIDMNSKCSTASCFQATCVDRVALRRQQRHYVRIAMVVLES